MAVLLINENKLLSPLYSNTLFRLLAQQKSAGRKRYSLIKHWFLS